MAFLRTLVIIFIVFYVIRLFARYILPGLFVNYMDNKVNEFKKQQKKQQQDVKNREGEVTINYEPGKNSKNKPSGGDYVDYVEVKE
jgi:hypothetical protein